jgi:hypothetical protein
MGEVNIITITTQIMISTDSFVSTREKFLFKKKPPFSRRRIRQFSLLPSINFVLFS